MARAATRQSRSRQRSTHWTYHFKAVEGSRYTDQDAQRIGPELTRIAQRDGEIRPQAVVDEARSRRSPFHRHFQWDIQKAAEQHWLDTAGRLIRAIKIEVVSGPQRAPKEVRAFVKIDRATGYRPTIEVFQRDDYRNAVLSRALEELEVWKKRYENFVDFSEIFGDVAPIIVQAQQRLRA
jgi:hypothetical protein